METKKCPYCTEEIAVEAIKCKHCHSILQEDNVLSEQEIDEIADQIVNEISEEEQDPEIYNYTAAKFWGWIFRLCAILSGVKEVMEVYGSSNGRGKYGWLTSIADVIPDGILEGLAIISGCYLLLSLREHFVDSRKSLAFYTLMPFIIAILWAVFIESGMDINSASLICSIAYGCLGAYVCYDIFTKHNKVGFIVGVSAIYFIIEAVSGYFDFIEEVNGTITVTYAFMAYMWGQYASEYLTESPRYATPSYLEEGAIVDQQYRIKRGFNIVVYIIYGTISIFLIADSLM